MVFFILIKICIEVLAFWDVMLCCRVRLTHPVFQHFSFFFGLPDPKEEDT